MSNRIKVYPGELLERLPRYPLAGLPRGASDLDALFPVRVLQVVGLSPGQSALAAVTHDSTLSGAGTVASPLSVVNQAAPGSLAATGKLLRTYNNNNNGFNSGTPYTLNAPRLFTTTLGDATQVNAGDVFVALMTAVQSAHGASSAPSGFTLYDTGSIGSVSTMDGFAAAALDSQSLNFNTTGTFAFGYVGASFMQGGIIAVAGATAPPDATYHSKITNSTYGSGSPVTIPAPASPGTTASLVLVWAAATIGVPLLPNVAGMFTLWSSSANKYVAGVYVGPATTVSISNSSASAQSVAACQLVLP